MYNIIKKKIPREFISYLGKNNFTISILQKVYHTALDAPVINMHLNSECNYNCQYCYSKKKISHKTDWMDVLDQCKELKVKEIQFLGGEPLLEKRIKDYIRICELHGMNIIIFTNGMLINDRLIKYLKQLKTPIRLAIKFDAKHCYEADIAGNKKDYFKMIDIIKRCVDNGISIVGHVTITRKNFNQVSEMIKVANNLNILLTFERYMPLNKGNNRIYMLTLNEWNIVLNMIQNYYSGIDKNYLVHSIIRGNTCNCCIDLLSIDVDGEVKPCPFSPIEESLGNVHTETLSDIWQLFKEKRKGWLRIPDECNGCNKKLICHGGCRTYTYIHKKTYDAKDPLCNKEIIPTIGWCGFGVKKR